MAHRDASTHFRLVQGEPLAASIRRIVREQIDEAIRLLTASTADRERVIRGSRVCCKKIRAVVRLVRKEIGAEVFELEDRCFRDARRALAPASDSESGECILDGVR